MDEYNGDIGLSVIIPVHSKGLKLEQCLKSLEDDGKGVSEVILVLDGTSIESHFFDQFDLPALRVEGLPQNRGPAYARNHGAGIASGDLLFFIDSDVSILPNTIDRLTAHFRKSGTPDALIGSYDDAPSEKALVSRFRNLLHHHTHQQGSANATTFWGACGAIKKEVFQATGGFDTSFEKPSVEDIALGYQLIQQGFSIKLDKTLQVKHLKKWTLSNMIKTDIFLRARPWTRLLHQYQKLGVNDLNINYHERAAVLLLTLAMVSLMGSLKFGFLLLLSLVSFLALFLVKRKTYRFFSRYFRWFQLPAILFFHWVYLGSALAGFIIALADRYFSFGRVDRASTSSGTDTYKKEPLIVNE